MTSEGKKTIFVVISILVVILLTLGVTFTVVIFSFSNSFRETPVKSSQEYQFTEINPFQGTFKRGFVNIPKTLKNEEYISYLNEETGSSIVITNFGGTDYECSGSCLCDEESRRVASAAGHLLTRGLMILLSAFSSSMAFSLASEVFRDQCIEKFSDVCDPAHVLSEVEECKHFKRVAPEETIKLEKRDFGPEDSDKFLCSGYCVGYEYMTSALFAKVMPVVDQGEFLEIGGEKIGSCEEIKMEKMMTFNYEKVRTELEIQVVKGQIPSAERVATIDFVSHLDIYCEQGSILQPEWWSEENRGKMLEYYKLATAKAAKEYRQAHTKLHQWLKGMPYCSGVKYSENKLGKKLSINMDNAKCVRAEDKIAQKET